LYVELELVHGIPQLMESPDISIFDVYWINTQAVNYAKACRKSKRDFSEEVIKNIESLARLAARKFGDQVLWPFDASAATNGVRLT
jgi:hypothetical protein